MPDHLKISFTDCYIAIVTGDPDRVPIIANLFENSSLISSERGFVSYAAFLKQTKIVIVATGIGGPSTAIVVEELIELGITTIIRIGTCGALQPEIKPFDIVIPTACVREEGTTLQYIDPVFPAIPDYVILQELIAHASTREHKFYAGIVHCKDAYYLERAGKQLDIDRTRQTWEKWRKAGVLATEMESSTLFVLGSIRKIRTGTILVNVGKNKMPALFEQSLKCAVDIVAATFTAMLEKNLLIQKSISANEDVSFLEEH